MNDMDIKLPERKAASGSIMENVFVTAANKPVVDLSECTRCGICTELYPDIFSMNDAGFVDIAECEIYLEEDVLDAIKNCPADCIYME